MKTVVRKDYSQTKPHELPFIKWRTLKYVRFKIPADLFIIYVILKRIDSFQKENNNAW